MSSNLTDNDITILLILVCLIFIKAVFSTIVHYETEFHQLGLSDNVLYFIESIKTLYSSFINLVSMLVGIYFIFIKNTTNAYFIFGFSVLIFKAIIHFLVSYKLYKFMDLTPEMERKLIVFRQYESGITNIVLLLFTFYIIKVIFI